MAEKVRIKLNTHEYNFQKGIILKLIPHHSHEKWSLMLSDDLIISSRDFPNAKIGDVVEIYLPEDTYRFVTEILLFFIQIKEYYLIFI